jgi:hypothetical protein
MKEIASLDTHPHFNLCINVSLVMTWLLHDLDDLLLRHSLIYLHVHHFAA